MGTKKKYFTYVGITAMVLLVVLIIGMIIIANNNKLICNSDNNLITKSKNALNSNDNVSLSSVVDKILAERGYAKDPNCDFILMSYYINISDGKSAQSNYNNLQKVYNSKRGLNPIFNDTAKDLSIYKSEIDLLISSGNLPAVHLGSGNEQSR